MVQLTKMPQRMRQISSLDPIYNSPHMSILVVLASVFHWLFILETSSCSKPKMLAHRDLVWKASKKSYEACVSSPSVIGHLLYSGTFPSGPCPWPGEYQVLCHPFSVLNPKVYGSITIVARSPHIPVGSWTQWYLWILFRVQCVCLCVGYGWVSGFKSLLLLRDLESLHMWLNFLRSLLEICLCWLRKKRHRKDCWRGSE